MDDFITGLIIYGIIVLPMMASLMAGGIYEDYKEQKQHKVSKAKRSKRNLHRSNY